MSEGKIHRSIKIKISNFYRGILYYVSYSRMLTFHEIMIIDDRYIRINLSEVRTFNFIFTDFDLSHPDRVILI